MRVLRLRAYYDPETTAGIHLDHDLSEGFSESGIDSVIWTPTPTRGVSAEVRAEYKKRRTETQYGGHVTVNRFPLMAEGRNPIQRALRYLLCNVKEYRRGCREKDIDLVYSSSTPPTQGLLSGKVAAKLSKKRVRKVPFVYNLQDVFPDSLVTTGMTHEGSLIWKLGRRIENATYRRADRIIVISEGFRRNLLAKGVPEEKITVISNWVDLDAVKPVPRAENRLFDEMGLSRETFTVVYAGNLGEAQGGDVILDAAKLLAEEKGIHFVIFGGGARYEAICGRVKSEGIDNVTVTGLLPQERVPEVYSLGDVALITCRKGTGNAGMPSKTWSIMACNTPIIASFDTDSDLADVIRASGAGTCVEPEDGAALAQAVREAYAARSRGDRQDLRAYAMATASKEACVAKYIEQLRAAAGRARE